MPAHRSHQQHQEPGPRQGLGLTLLVLLLAPVIPQLFSTDELVLSRATVALVGLAVMQVPAAIAFTLDGVLEGASDFGFLQWALIGALSAFAPFVVLVLVRPSLGLAGLWAGLVAWMTARAVILLLRFRGTRWLHLGGA
jgi:Na+-driven multidrug efflux pump